MATDHPARWAKDLQGGKNSPPVWHQNTGQNPLPAPHT